MTVRVPPAHCPRCGHVLDAAEPTDLSDAAPTEGDVSICMGCVAVNVFKADLTLRSMGDAEWLSLDLDARTEIQRAQDMIIDIMQRAKGHANMSR